MPRKGIHKWDFRCSVCSKLVTITLVINKFRTFVNMFNASGKFFFFGVATSAVKKRTLLRMLSIWYWRTRRPVDVYKNWTEAAVGQDEDDIWSELDLGI
jgi:hypothetical protein